MTFIDSYSSRLKGISDEVGVHRSEKILHESCVPTDISSLDFGLTGELDAMDDLLRHCFPFNFMICI